ncbi:ParB/RepB/Spo0J family partition protein [Bordetella bronchiseptica]|uniref:ParB/RepB/Spo0J family partition protein n=1 Tax=Bordetella bronchiseptica TaxID=518 RepID=UPI000460D433|nr:ParB/RepB/Spo0J family partition protein [Bordetella bronchiseptica]KDD09938.1 ParB-like protein [Bordetella bronchiseptica MBORD707]
MAKNSVDAYGASGKTNVLFFQTDALVLVSDPDSPLYDERVHLPVDERLARNIDYQGVLEPVAVSKNPETGAVEVVFGRQRVKAAMLANEWREARGEPPRQVPGIVYQGKRQNALDAIASENEARTADTPLGRAEKMRRHMALGRGEDQIAVIYNCTITTVRDTLALLDSPKAVQDAVEGGQITLTHAKALAKLAPDEQRAKVAELVEAGKDAKPHERSRRQAAVMGERPRLKSRKQILVALQAASGDYAAALRWVLGEATPATQPEQEPA